MPLSREYQFCKPLIFLHLHVKPHSTLLTLHAVAKKGYQAVGFTYNLMLKLSRSRGIRIDVPVLSVSWFLWITP